MACFLLKLSASSSSWIAGQQAVNQRPGSAARFPTRRVSVIRAGSYTDELIKTAVRNFSVLACGLIVWYIVLFIVFAFFFVSDIGRLEKSIASPGRGILAIDESNATCGKRLASIGLDNTETNRQAYRQLLLTTPGLGEYISGAILFEETLYQSTTDGKKFVDCLRDENIVPGIKVDKGLVPLPGSNNESWCQGLDGLASRSAEYYKQGARFAKWRTVVSIPCGPSALAVKEAAWGLARYAAISQENGLVPIVEPEILLDGIIHREGHLKWQREYGPRSSTTWRRTMSRLKEFCLNPAW
ncbi:UNVERIFIED_CONTAM: Fructose-bisphosphate aldolase 3, chloroplastic [Sesamum radiatum]|uniref:fructose-bisphosphate aldolase n=1 Tax=Sesamum radiatum TaxID=300843 RepID=A0AAW2VAK5_SESRA